MEGERLLRATGRNLGELLSMGFGDALMVDLGNGENCHSLDLGQSINISFLCQYPFLEPQTEFDPLLVVGA
jgi:hypothetical protein